MRIDHREILHHVSLLFQLLLNSFLDVINYLLELLDSIGVFLCTSILKYTDIPLDRNNQAFTLILLVSNYTLQIKEFATDLITLEFGIRSTKGAAVEDRLSDLTLLKVINQIFKSKERTLGMSLCKQIKYVTQSVRYLIFAHRNLISQLSVAFTQHHHDIWRYRAITFCIFEFFSQCNIEIKIFPDSIAQSIEVPIFGQREKLIQLYSLRYCLISALSSRNLIRSTYSTSSSRRSITDTLLFYLSCHLEKAFILFLNRLIFVVSTVQLNIETSYSDPQV